MENFDIFSLLFFFTCIILIQVYFLIISFFSKKLLQGSVFVIIITLFLMYTWNVIPDILGYPYKSKSLPKEFRLIEFVEYPSEKKLLIWLIQKDKKRPRVYEIDIDRDLLKKLRRAKKNGVNRFYFERIEKNNLNRRVYTEKYDLRVIVRPEESVDFKNL